ncbi:hypothetical protein [Streptomyces sp. NPDC020667]|uniref:hypothetical protein n=1 Tax=Streptomyces sp. NPDC020667 TaxID=3154895 RepID=UPI0033F79761
MPLSRSSSVLVRRLAVSVVPPLVCAAVVLWVFLSVRDRLPGRIASHIGPGGNADGFSGQGSFLGVAWGVLLGDGVLFGALVYFTRPGNGGQRVLAVIGGAVAVLTGWLATAVLLANTGVHDASSVTLPGAQAALAFGAAALYAAVGWAACGKDEGADSDSGPSADASRLALGDSEIAGWSRVAGSRVLPLTGVLVFASGVVVGVAAGWLSALSLFLIGAAMTLLTGVRVTADRRGLTVTPSTVPWPRINVPLQRIAEAGHRPVKPLRDFGGWGYRVRSGASGVVLRSGDAISVRLTTGSEFVVTVDDAATAAALLNTLADRERRTSAGG